jgi:hypothetical protein
VIGAVRWGIGGVPRPGSRRAERPLLYLDVDGVLNPLSPNAPAGFVRREAEGLPVWLSPEHGAWLRELAERYQLVWATTWEHLANEHLGAFFGLPELPVVEFSAYRRRSDDPRFGILQLLESRKWAPILRHADGRPFAWVDDVIPMRVRRQAWPHRAILLVPVTSAEGLTRAHVDRLLTWPRAAPRTRPDPAH